MKISFTSSGRRWLKASHLSQKIIALTCERPTIQAANPVFTDPRTLSFAGCRWFDDGQVVLVHGYSHDWANERNKFVFSELTVHFCLQLRTRLPQGSLARGMNMLEILNAIGESFGQPVSWESYWSDLGHGLPFSLRNPGLYRLGVTTPDGESFGYDISLPRYERWLDEITRPIQLGPAVRQIATHLGESVPGKETASFLNNLCNEFRTLLADPGTDEERVHRWLFNDPLHHVFLSSSATRVLSKVPFGSHVADFVVQLADDRYLLIEIEHPGARIFRKNGDSTADFNHACQQVKGWQWFVSENVDYCRKQLKLPGIARPSGMVMIGREHSLESDVAKERWRALKSQLGLDVYNYDEIIGNVRALARILPGGKKGI